MFPSAAVVGENRAMELVLTVAIADLHVPDIDDNVAWLSDGSPPATYSTGRRPCRQTVRRRRNTSTTAAADDCRPQRCAVRGYSVGTAPGQRSTFGDVVRPCACRRTRLSSYGSFARSRGRAFRQGARSAAGATAGDEPRRRPIAADNGVAWRSSPAWQRPSHGPARRRAPVATTAWAAAIMPAMGHVGGHPSRTGPWPAAVAPARTLDDAGHATDGVRQPPVDGQPHVVSGSQPCRGRRLYSAGDDVQRRPAADADSGGHASLTNYGAARQWPAPCRRRSRRGSRAPGGDCRRQASMRRPTTVVRGVIRGPCSRT